MYPIIAPSFSIRGIKNSCFLADSRTFALIPLEHELLASIIMNCDGQKSLSALAEQFQVATSEMRAFLEKFETAGALSFSESPVVQEIMTALGPESPWLREVHLDITNRCNQAPYCRHCFRGNKLNLGDERSIDEWNCLIDELSTLGVYNISISGGEPLLRRDLPQIVQFIIDRRMFLGAIFTNGTMWTQVVEDIIARLVERKIGTTFYISLDGPDANTHDANRGPGAFARTIAFIQHLVSDRANSEASFKIAINSQVNSINYKKLQAWYRSISELGVDRWRLTSGRVTGRLEKNPALLPPRDTLFDEYVTMIRSHIEEHRAGAHLILNVESFFNTKMLDEGVALTFTEEMPICDYKEQACSIEPNGDVQFCTSWGSRCFGNVFKDGIRNVWYSTELQNLKSMKVKDIVECRGCKLLVYCGGGCRLVAEDTTRKDPYSCEQYRLFESHILPMLQAEGVKFTSEREEL